MINIYINKMLKYNILILFYFFFKNILTEPGNL